MIKPRLFFKSILQVALFLLLINPVSASTEVIESEKQDFKLDLIASLEDPWGMAFTPDGDILITQKTGALRVFRNGQLLEQEVVGLPKISVTGQGGLLDIALDPDFENNRFIYLSYAGGDWGRYSTEVLRARLEQDQLSDVDVIFNAEPKGRGGRHFGSRLLFGPDGMLYVSLGDRGHRPHGQDLGTHAGSLIRIRPDGSVPEDNPFVGQSGVLEEIYTLGNRNMQGMALHPDTGEIWTHEHGPQGGDELNLMQAGHNYGWADITYGVNYVVGTSIGEGATREDVTPPVHYWTPSIAPSGMAFYSADAFPEWRGHLFIGSLKFLQLVRLELDGNKVVHEERISLEKYGRVRDVRQGPDGYIYLLIEGGRTGLYRLSPVGG